MRLLGITPKMVQYGHTIVQFNLPNQDQGVEFAQWNNPHEKPKIIHANQLQFFAQFIKPGQMAIDIGAHTGDTTVPMALVAGKQGLVLAFDPNPLVFEVLKINASLNPNLTNIMAYPYAVAEQSGEFYYHSSENSFNNGGISAKNDGQHGAFDLGQTVQAVELTAFLQKNHPDKLPQLALIKIDAEGYDLQIISAISNLINNYKPVIIADCFSKLNKAQRSQMWETMHQHGYELFYFSGFDINAKVIKLASPSDMLRWKHFDWYGLPAGENKT